LGAAHENALKDSPSCEHDGRRGQGLGAAHENALKDSHPVNMMAEEVSNWVLLMKMH
jgi:hypothetical protein